MNFFDALFEQGRLYFDVFDRMLEAFYIHDVDRNMVYMNKAAEKLDGYRLKDVKGKSAFELYGLDESTSPLLQALVTERPVVNRKFCYYVNGRKNIQLCNAAPIYKDGKLVGAYTLQRDLTPFNDLIEENIHLQHALSIGDKGAESASRETPLFSSLIGSCKSFLRCKELASQVAKTDSSVMLVGATGSGKEVFARAIHQGSNRIKMPFLALNCAAIPESLIESILFGTTKGVYTGAIEKEGLLAQADGGTVFLDEINSMPLASQAKLLRVLEERKIMKLGSNKEMNINVRIISSINEAPQAAVDNGHLREDLFYRLSVVQIAIPSLEERKEDIPELVDYFINKYNARFNKRVRGLSSDVMDYFMHYSWSGNVRQLKACIESSMNFVQDGDSIHFDDLPQYVLDTTTVQNKRYRHWFCLNDDTDTSITTLKSPVLGQDIRSKDIIDSVWQEEREAILKAILEAKGNFAQAANMLKISPQLLNYRLKKYKIR